MALPARLPSLRDDIHVFPSGTTPLGLPSWRLYDPLRNRFFQLGEAEFHLLLHWHLGDPEAVLGAVAAEMPMPPDADFLEQWLLFLHQHQLLARAGKAGVQALAALVPPRRSRWQSLIHNYLFFRIPLANPDRFYGWLAPHLRCLFSPAVWVVLAILGLSALWQLLGQWDRFTATFSYAFSVEGLLWLGVSLLLLKTAHEMGHGVAARHHGLHVTRTGIAFLVLWPVLYTDVNDIWKLGDWRRRLQISVAGVATELGLAVLATWGWLLLPEGPLQSALFIVATTAWILSLAINLNPLLRFDGYYLLSDLLDYPNLQEDAFAAARYGVRRLTGLQEERPSSGHLAHWPLAAFGYATWLYRAALFSGIAWFVYTSFPKLLGVPLALVELLWFIGRPVWREVQIQIQRRSEIARGRRRLGMLLMAALLLLLALPWSGRVSAPAYLAIEGRRTLYAPQASRVEVVAVREGQRVAAGDLLIRLVSPELTLRRVQAEQRLAAARIALAAAGGADRGRQERLLVLMQELAERQLDVDAVEAELQRLELRAEVAARVRDLPADLQPGRWVRREQPLGLLLPLDASARPRLLAYVAEADYERVQIGAAARFFVAGQPGSALAARVRSRAVTRSRQVEESGLLSVSGGSLPSSWQGRSPQIHGAYYAVELEPEAGIEPERRRTQLGEVQIRAAAYNPLLGYLSAALARLNRELSW